MAADLDDPPSRTASPGPASGSGGAPRTNGGPSDIEGNGSAQRRAAGAGSVAVESAAGHRIAYDPRDLTDEAETTENPKLTLMEEVLLLGLKDKQVSLQHVSREPGPYCALAGGQITAGKTVC